MFWEAEKESDLVALSEEAKGPIELKVVLLGSELVMSVHFWVFGEAGSDQLAKKSTYL